MKLSIALRQDAEGALWLEKGQRPPRRVVTVATACQRLRRGRRQVYRLMKAGRLGPPQKMLGEWLLDQATVERLARAPLSAQPLPRRLKPLFPEYEPKALNAGRDNVLIISRVLEGGGLEDLRWLIKRYPNRDIRRVIQEEGSRLLSPRSRRLWSLVFKTTPRPLSAWRRDDPWRGAQPFKIKEVKDGTCHLDLAGTTVSLFRYAYPIVGGPDSWRELNVASLEDIAAMKLSAVLGRGSKKDFIDLHVLCRRLGLVRVMETADRKFPLHSDFPLQAARALLYFEDAEKEPMPRMIGAISWEDVKSYFEGAVPTYVKEHLKR